MTVDLNQGIIVAPGEKHRLAPVPPTSPLRKDASNPQQGMADPAASVSATTTATVANTTCTSPLTVTSLEAAAAAGIATPSRADGLDVPQVVSRVVPVVPRPERTVPSVEAMLSAPMAKLGLDSALSAAIIPPSRTRTEEKQMRLRTPPTEHDNRKLFVGGLPTDVTDHSFVRFFEQFGEVIDSVVMVDRVTKRSRGFGFVTFAAEDDANSLLTAIPGKTGYVIINGKQCEVKASTPKVDDGPNRHSPGMWKPNPPHDNRGYSARRSNHGPNPMGSKLTHHHHPRGQKQIYIDQEFKGDIDGRNFDEVYLRQMMQPRMDASYQTMNIYGRNFTTANPMYHQNYQNVYPNAPPNGYVYPNSSSAASVPSSWEESHTAPSQGYGQYPSNAMSNNGYYDPYDTQQLYPSNFSNEYNNNSMNQPAVMGQTGYAHYSSHLSGNQEKSSIPAQGVNATDSGFEPYQTSYPVEGEYNVGGSADQYK